MQNPTTSHGSIRKSYKELLRSRKWQKRSAQIKHQRGWRCEICHDVDLDFDRPLHVHHRSYDKDKPPWDYPDENFLCLCERCHEYEHFKEFALPILDQNTELKRKLDRIEQNGFIPEPVSEREAWLVFFAVISTAVEKEWLMQTLNPAWVKNQTVYTLLCRVRGLDTIVNKDDKALKDTVKCLRNCWIDNRLAELTKQLVTSDLESFKKIESEKELLRQMKATPP